MKIVSEWEINSLVNPIYNLIFSGEESFHNWELTKHFELTWVCVFNHSILIRQYEEDSRKQSVLLVNLEFEELHEITFALVKTLVLSCFKRQQQLDQNNREIQELYESLKPN